MAEVARCLGACNREVSGLVCRGRVLEVWPEDRLDLVIAERETLLHYLAPHFLALLWRCQCLFLCTIYARRSSFILGLRFRELLTYNIEV